MLESIEESWHRPLPSGLPREDDKLVKIFTEQAGKLMFSLKHANRSRLNSMIQLKLTLADMYHKLMMTDSSYIRSIHEV